MVACRRLNVRTSCSHLTCSMRLCAPTYGSGVNCGFTVMIALVVYYDSMRARITIEMSCGLHRDYGSPCCFIFEDWFKWNDWCWLLLLRQARHFLRQRLIILSAVMAGALSWHSTGSAESGFLSYRKDAGIIKLFHRGKLISEKRIQNIQQSVYQTSGAPLINYEFDVDRNNFYILALDMSTQGASGGEPDIKLWGTDAVLDLDFSLNSEVLHE